jgi:hypothetical protein
MEVVLGLGVPSIEQLPNVLENIRSIQKRGMNPCSVLTNTPDRAFEVLPYQTEQHVIILSFRSIWNLLRDQLQSWEYPLSDDS